MRRINCCAQRKKLELLLAGCCCRTFLARSTGEAHQFLLVFPFRPLAGYLTLPSRRRRPVLDGLLGHSRGMFSERHGVDGLDAAVVFRWR